MNIRTRCAPFAAALLLLSFSAVAQKPYPSQPIHLIVGAAAGGPTDMVARLLGDEMSKSLGVPIVVQNKGGGGGVIAAKYVANMAPDGYTLLMGSISTHGINTTLYKHLGYDAVKDFAPISEVVSYPLVLLTNPATVPAKSVGEFIDFARENPNTIDLGSAGNGTSMHLAGELFKHVAGVTLNHIPYRGSAPAVQALLARQVDVDFESINVSLAHIQSGSLRALGVTGAERSPVLPDVPPIAETLPGYEFNGWLGLVAPAGTPPEIIERLHQSTVTALAVPALREKLLAQAVQPVGSSPQEFSAFIKDQIVVLGKIVRSSGAEVD